MYIKYDNINNYNFDKYNDRKKQHYLARILLKDILNNKYNMYYQDDLIKYNEFGKPYLDDINFNISHSYDYVIVAVSQNNVGIDIEKIRKVKLSIMNIFCTDNEKQYIFNSKNKYLAFWKIYTLKEAYFKMLGTDLSNMKKVEFNICDDNVVCINNPNLKIYISTEINDYIFSIIYE